MIISKRILKWTFLLVYIIAFNSCDEYSSSYPKNEDQELRQEQSFIRYLESLQETNLTITRSPGASINIVKDSILYFQRLFGVKSVHTKAPVTEQTLFRVGSLSKGFTGILAAKLHEKGIIDLEQSAIHYLPCLSKHSSKIVEKVKLYHLLSHSAGIVPHAYTRDIEQGILPIDLCSQFEALITESRIGDHFYQNAFFALIEQVIEQKTGKTFVQSMKDELFVPLQMGSVVFNHDSYIKNEDHAVPHRWNKKTRKYEVTPFKKKYYNAISAGGISMSSADMFIWMEALLGHRKDVISEKVLQLAFHKHVDTKNDPRTVNLWPGVNAVHYGLGWRIVDYQGKELMYHAGYVDEFRSEILIDPQDNLGIFAVFNCTNSYSNKLIPNLLLSLEFYKAMNSNRIKQIKDI